MKNTIKSMPLISTHIICLVDHLPKNMMLKEKECSKLISNGILYIRKKEQLQDEKKEERNNEWVCKRRSAQVEQELLLNQVIENIELKKLSLFYKKNKRTFRILILTLKQESKNRFKKL